MRNFIALAMVIHLASAAAFAQVVAHPRIWLDGARLTEVRAKAQANTTQWQAFKNHLDSHLNEALTSGYQGGLCDDIINYALGYQVLKNIDAATAQKYADKGIGLLKHFLRDNQFSPAYGGTMQVLARGDGSAVSFTLPNADYIASSFKVYTAQITQVAMTHAQLNGLDRNAALFYGVPIKVSNTLDGTSDYIRGVDWKTDLYGIDWSPSAGSEPVVGAAYYVTFVNFSSGKVQLSAGSGYSLSGTDLTLTAPPTSSQAVIVSYVYGTHAGDYSTLAYQQTGDTMGGIVSIQKDSGYPSRFLGKGAAIAYDWLYDYPGFTVALKNEAVTVMNLWVDWWDINGYKHGAPLSNYGVGGAVSEGLVSLATYGDNANAPAYFARSQNFYINTLKPNLINDKNGIKGGFWAEGWNYGDLSVSNYLEYFEAMRTALDSHPDYFLDTPFASDLVSQTIQSLPTLTTIYDAGDWYAFPAPLTYGRIKLLSSLCPDATLRSYANYLLQNPSEQAGNDYVDLLYRVPGAAAAYWSSEPLAYRTGPTGVVTAHSAWGANNIMLSFKIGNLVNADHQSEGEGSLQLWRGTDYLLIDGTQVKNYQAAHVRTRYFNTLVIDDGGAGFQTYRYNQGSWYGGDAGSSKKDVLLDTFEGTSTYTYAGGDYSNAYTKPDLVTKSASRLERRLFYLRPNTIFVYDRADTEQAAFTKDVYWNALSTPIVFASSFTITQGASKVLGKVFWPATATLVKSSMSANGPSAGTAPFVHQVIVGPGNVSKQSRFLHVLQAGDSTLSELPSNEPIQSVDGSAQGARVGGNIVIFSTSGLAMADITYNTSQSGALDHFVIGMSPALYDVYRDGSKVISGLATSAKGVLNFQSPGPASWNLVQAGGLPYHVPAKPKGLRIRL